MLHHIRYLLGAGLIRLIDTRIKGGNVEKYYRAVARMYGIRASPELTPAVAVAEMEAAAQEVAASVAVWRERGIGPSWESRRAHLTKERRDEFQRRLNDLIREYFGGPYPGDTTGDIPLPQGEDGPMWALLTVLYRDPTAPDEGSVQQ